MRKNKRSERLRRPKPSPFGGGWPDRAGRGFCSNVIHFAQKPPLSLRDISPKGGDIEAKSVSKLVPPPLKGEGDRG